MKLSIVTTLYCSAPYIAEYVERMTTTAQRIVKNDYEIVIVNDGSPDNALEIANGLVTRYPQVRVVDLTKNFGHLKAMMTGLAQTKGDLVFQMDCDLEEDPELLEEFFDAFRANPECDVVWGQQIKRKGGLSERLSGAVFYRVFNLLSEHRLQVNHTNSRIMSRRYVEALLSHKDRDPLLAGLWVLAGFKQLALPYQKRSKGSSTYTFGKKIALVVNSVTAYSTRPLVALFYLGLFIMSISLVAACYVIFRKLFGGIPVDGWSMTIISVTLLGGLTTLCLGVVGIYLAKVMSEIRDRPLVTIKQIYDR